MRTLTALLFVTLTISGEGKPRSLAEADKLAVKDLQLTIVTADRDMLQIEKLYAEAKGRRDKAQADLVSLIERLRPKDCPKCELTSALVWETVKEQEKKSP